MRINPISYSKGGTSFLLGSSALKALKAKRLVPQQIEAARRVITRKFKKKAKLWLRVFADIPVSQKPKEVRMGKGKGAVSFWTHRLNAGKIVFELANVSKEVAQEVLVKAGKKLPVPSAVIHRK